MDDNDFYEDHGHFDDDRAAADPEIKRAYQLALGRLILAHNEVDFWMTILLVKSARNMAAESQREIKTVGKFAERAQKIMVLVNAEPSLPLGGVVSNRLLELNKVRNDLAHAHFDQDPYEDSFDVVKARHHHLNQERLNHYNMEVINGFSAELEGIASHMRTVEIYFDYICSNRENFPIPTAFSGVTGEVPCTASAARCPIGARPRQREGGIFSV